MHSLPKISAFLLSLLALNFLTGCQPVANLYIGNFYTDAKTFPLAVSDTAQAELDTFELRSTFSYKTTGNVLSISGTAEFGSHYQLMYEKLNSYNLFLFFLDDNHLVVGGVRLYNGHFIDPDKTFPFDQEVTIPATATQIAMGFEANFSSTESEAGGGGRELIYRLPLSSGR